MDRSTDSSASQPQAEAGARGARRLPRPPSQRAAWRVLWDSVARAIASRWTVGGLVALGVGVLYVFMGTAGTMSHFAETTKNYYEQLAVAFADGHLELVQRPEPTDQRGLLEYRYWDLSLYKGRLYPYWGPVPALFGAALLRLFGWHPTDPVLTVLFVWLRALLGIAMVVRAKSVFFPRQPWWPTVFGACVLAVGGPVSFLLTRPAVYEVAIAAAQCLLLAGVAFVFWALDPPRREARTRALLAAAGLCWALALGCRITSLPACAGLFLLSCAADVVPLPRGKRLRVLRIDAAWLAAPIAAGLCALALYNRARFGSLFDTGLRYQLDSGPFHYAPRFAALNLYNYTAKPPVVDSAFPFLHVADFDGFWLWRLFPELSLAPSEIWHERNIGLLCSTPFYALSLVTVFVSGRWLVRAAAQRDERVVGSSMTLSWLCASSLAMAVLGTIPCVLGNASSPRYQMDASTGLALASTLGLGFLVAIPRRSRAARGALVAIASALTAISILVNAAVWVDGGMNDFLATQNPSLFKHLSALFSLGAGGHEPPRDEQHKRAGVGRATSPTSE